MSEPIYPNIEVKLTGTDGNAVAIVGAVKKALLRSGINPDEYSKFQNEAFDGDYDHLLQTCLKWVKVN